VSAYAFIFTATFHGRCCAAFHNERVSLQVRGCILSSGVARKVLGVAFFRQIFMNSEKRDLRRPWFIRIKSDSRFIRTSRNPLWLI